MDVIYSFGEWVQQRRRTLRLTQAEVAFAVGCSKVLIRKIESDERRPSEVIAKRLAHALHIAPDDLPAFVRSARALHAIDQLPHPQQSPVLLQPAQRLQAIPALPIQPIGRQATIQEIAKLFSQHRLVTLIGSPGIGKTTFALLAAAQLQDRYKDGAAFIPLAATTDARLIPQVVARIFDLPLVVRQPADVQVQTYCQDRQLLLIFDNAEHVLDVRLFIAQLLASAPRLHILVTSRSALHIRGEYLLPVLPLEEADAMTLFEQRASATLLPYQASKPMLCMLRHQVRYARR
jgi:transcriptional regulator with XRE-family HTH domain